jgi:hypothetical protein
LRRLLSSDSGTHGGAISIPRADGFVTVVCCRLRLKFVSLLAIASMLCDRRQFSIARNSFTAPQELFRLHLLQVGSDLFCPSRNGWWSTTRDCTSDCTLRTNCQEQGQSLATVTESRSCRASLPPRVRMLVLPRVPNRDVLPNRRRKHEWIR